MATNYATQYASALSQQYPYMLHFGAIYGRNQENEYKFIEANTIKIPSVSVTGRVDGSRSAITSLGSRSQAHNNAWTALVMRNHRKWEDLIHPRDITDTNQALSIGNITRVFNETEKFPEKDRYLISTTYADWKALGRVEKTGTLTKDNILGYFDAMMVQMTEKNVPVHGRILYITPNANLALKQAITYYRTELTAPATVQRAIKYLDEVSVEEVPSDSMKTAYDFTVGSVPGASAKQIEMFLVHPTAIITPESYEFAQLDAPTATTQGKWLYYEEVFEDVFILPNKQYAIEYLVAGMTASAVTFTSAASLASGAVAGDCLITITAPSGDNLKAGSRYFYKAASGTAPDAVAYGEVASEAAGWTEWDGKATTVVNITNGHKATILVTDADARVYASGNGTITSLAAAN
jgi:hypothetical protein